jgi:NAD(P)-dependent dehydrogenase (short-subunit alcohol dehydrogenase family)
MNKVIIITGVSSGIGLGLAEHYLSKGHNVIGTVRDADDASGLKSRPNFQTVVYDVSNKAGITGFIEQVRSILGDNKIFALINNAGIAVAGPLECVSEEDFSRQMEINVFAVRRVTNSLLPYMDAGSRIVMMSSVSGLLNSPFTGPYCISKHALESMADVYRRELALFDIKVIAIEPGPIQSKIWGKSKGSLDKYKDTRYAFITEKADKMIENAEKNALPVSAVCSACDKALYYTKPSVRYIVHKKPLIFKLIATFLPDNIMDKLVARNLKSGNSHRAI